MNKWLRYFAKGIGLAALAALLGFVAGSWIIAGQFIAPDPTRVTWPKQFPTASQDVTFPASDGVRLQGWFLPQANSTSAVVVLHGVSANRYQVLDRARWLSALGYNVLLYDSRGCGESAPAAHSFGWHETRDLLGAVSWLQARGMTHIGCVGFSQGAATILLASGQLPASVRAVVAEGPYVTLQATIDDHFRSMTGHPSCFFGALIVPFAEWKLGMNIADVSPLREIPKLKVPLYLIGGGADTLAPAAGVRQLYDAALCEKYLWVIDGAGHENYFSRVQDQYQQRVGDFLKSHL
jgi:alpha-beta hydrolase superfamily lysophospholipase